MIENHMDIGNDDDVSVAAVIEHQARPLVEHVRVQAVGMKQSNPVLQFHAAGLDFFVLQARDLNPLRHLPQGQNTPVTAKGVKGEVDDYANTQNRADDMPRTQA